MPFKNPLPHRAPRAYGDFGLIDVISCSQRVQVRVEEGEDPLLLILLEGSPQKRGSRESPDHENKKGPPPEFCKENDGKRDDEYGKGSPKIRLFNDESAGDGNDDQGQPEIPQSELRHVGPVLIEFGKPDHQE